MPFPRQLLARLYHPISAQPPRPPAGASSRFGRKRRCRSAASAAAPPPPQSSSSTTNNALARPLGPAHDARPILTRQGPDWPPRPAALASHLIPARPARPPQDEARSKRPLSVRHTTRRAHAAPVPPPSHDYLGALSRVRNVQLPAAHSRAAASPGIALPAIAPGPRETGLESQITDRRPMHSRHTSQLPLQDSHAAHGFALRPPAPGRPHRRRRTVYECPPPALFSRTLRVPTWP